MIRPRVRAFVVAGLLVAGQGADAQTPRPAAPPRGQPSAPPAGPPMATICSTDKGWCPLKVVAPQGAPCECVVPPDTHLPGVTRYFSYEEPVDPYLNPHTQ